MAAPTLLWWGFFFVIPLTWMAYYSFGIKPAEVGAGPVDLSDLSLANYTTATSDIFISVFGITMRTAGLGTIACALIGFPVAYALAHHVPARWKTVLLFILVLPYWINFLLRAFAWRIVLAPEGALSHALQYMGILSGPLSVLDSNTAVQLGIIYNYLPLMVLPMFVALDRIDPALVQGSMDLGATPLRTFFSITLPLAAPGILGGLVLTFVLASGDYVVPAILGGAKGLMIGNLVAIQILSAQNLPLGSAMAVLLIIFLVAIILGAGLLLLATRRLLKACRGPAIDAADVAASETVTRP